MSTTLGGHRLTRAQYKLVEQLRQHGLEPITSRIELRRNPHTGATALLSPLALVLFDWIVSPNRGDEITAGKYSKGLWDEARYLFQTLWPEEYYDLLD